MARNDFQASSDSTITEEWDECHCCGEPMKVSGPHWRVHMTTDLRYVAASYDGDDSQGTFPVGTRCRKRYRVAFRVQS